MDGISSVERMNATRESSWAKERLAGKEFQIDFASATHLHTHVGRSFPPAVSGLVFSRLPSLLHSFPCPLDIPFFIQQAQTSSSLPFQFRNFP